MKSSGASPNIKFTVPPNASASISDVKAFVTSILESIVGEIIFRSTPRSVRLVAGICSPPIKIVLYVGARPRMTTRFASPPLRVMETPGKRPIDSAALASGTSMIRSDETIFLIVFDCICWLIAAA